MPEYGNVVIAAERIEVSSVARVAQKRVNEQADDDHSARFGITPPTLPLASFMNSMFVQETGCASVSCWLMPLMSMPVPSVMMNASALLHHEEPVDKPDGRAAEHRNRNGKRHSHAAVHELDCHNAAEAHHAANGEAAARGNDRQRYAKGDDLVHRRVF